MHKWSIRIALMAVAIVTALAGADRASADGVVFIDACQTLSIANTVYKLTADLTSCGSCLVVANDKITIDLQGHSIIGCGNGRAVVNLGDRDVIVVKNGSVNGFFNGVDLGQTTRASVLGVTATNNFSVGIAVGAQGLVKSSEVSGSSVGIQVGDRGQVQQCNVHDNGAGIVASNADNCLITMNTANSNNDLGISVLRGNKCTVSYNTASKNGQFGIILEDTVGALVTRNVALDNGTIDYRIGCPSTVTYNDSTNGFPTSYDLQGNGCHTVNNN